MSLFCSGRNLLFCLIIFLLLPALFLPLSADGNSGIEYSSNSPEETRLYYFWGHCPICSRPEDHIGLFDDYPVEVVVYEVFHDPDGRAVYDQFSARLGIDTYGFPTLVYGDQYWLGFSETVQAEILEAIEADSAGGQTASRAGRLIVPIIGEIDLMASPLFLTTAIIATLDGFNPCSLFVLTFLLAIIVHSASRKRILIVGITFLLVTSSVYGLFMLGVLNIMIFAGQLFWIRNLVAAIVIILGLVGIKDFFIFKEGVSFAIPESYKKKYYSQVRNIFYTDSILPTIAATAVMALGISLVELPCTAGFPFIWSSIVSGRELPLTYFLALFFLYLFLYLLIEIIIFGMAVIRMRSIKMTEERGRFLKLVAGSLMLVLGLILLVRPDYMENVLGIIITFGVSLTLILMLYYFRKLLKYIKEKV